MANPFYNESKANAGAPDFIKFMQNMKGKDPNQIISNMVSSGQMSQQEFEYLKGAAKQFITFLK